MFKSSIHRLTWAVALVTVLALPATATTTPEAGSAASWIADELGQPQPSFDVFGKTPARTDVVYALAAAQAEPAAFRQALAELRDGLADYLGEAGSADSGALAKTLLATETAGIGSWYTEGRRLAEELRATMAASGEFPGGVFVQALAMTALGATAEGVPDAAVAFLEGLQCPAGYFTYATCDTDPVGDVDTTALALQALVAAGSDEAAAAAAGWLVAHQNPDGSWPNPFGDPNANSAGVAGQALRAAGRTGPADLAGAFVVSLQTGDGGIKFVASDTEPNGFATLQGVLALGAPPLFALEMAPFADVGPDQLFFDEVSWMGISGFSRGCDPPADTAYCPQDRVTRGEMAAFLVRALGLPAGDGPDFTDVTGSVFAGDISRLAAAGITRGCNPPDNTRYCPQRTVTRGEMAAFLVRALGLPAGDGPDFTDVTGSVFARDISRLAAAGITRGCNPPENTRFCPEAAISRGEMAALLFRALEG